MKKRPMTIYILILLWLTLSAMFILWGVFSLFTVVEVPEWITLKSLQPQMTEQRTEGFFSKESYRCR